MERIKHRDRIFELVVDGVLIPVKRVQRGHLNVRAECPAASIEPVPIHRPGAAGHQVKQPGPDPSGLVTGQIDHPGQLLRAPLGNADVVPVGSARGAVTALPLFRFPGPPAEPAVRLSPQRALHDRLLVRPVGLSVSTGSGCGSRGSGTGSQ
jgi:hypothetical protein